MLQAVAQADVLDEVGRVGQAGLAGAVVEHAQAARAGHEVDAVPAEVGERVAVPVVQHERGRGVAHGHDLGVSLRGSMNGIAAVVAGQSPPSGASISRAVPGFESPNGTQT